MTKKYDLMVKNLKKVHFSHFCLKTRLTRCLRRLISQIFLQQNSKMAWPGVVKRFEVKSHQIWALYLQPVRNGGWLSPRGGSRSPPHLLGLRKSNNADSTLYMISQSQSQPKTNCIFKTFRVKESFRAPRTKFLVMKSWFSEVLSDFCFCLF